METREENTTPRLRRLRRSIKLPVVSGKASALVLVACFALTGVLIPVALRLPAWVDAEAVLAVWWALWLGVLTGLLYAGRQVSDDHRLAPPAGAMSPGGWWDWFPEFGFLGLEGCLLGLVVLLVVALLGVVAWFVAEFAVPLLTFVLYLAVRGMLAQAVNGRPACQGRLGRSLAVALGWATLYTAPVAGAVWLIHALHRAHS
jgi:hypothetical protein